MLVPQADIIAVLPTDRVLEAVFGAVRVDRAAVAYELSQGDDYYHDVWPLSAAATELTLIPSETSVYSIRISRPLKTSTVIFSLV